MLFGGGVREKKMKARSFIGGVHPKTKKTLSSGKAITQIEAGNLLVFPLSRHIGAPSVPVVSVGDRVLVGTLIAKAGGFVGENIHSSVSGKVKAIEMRPTDNGGKMLSVVVENDRLYEKAEGFGLPQSDEELSDPATVKQIIADSGIIGMGGAGFPFAVKLSPKNPENIKYVIVNAAECEPYITCDHRLMLERGEKLIKGAKAVSSLFPGSTVIIGVENNKPDAIDNLVKLTAGDTSVRIAALKAKYPQGGERMLVYALTGEKLNSSMLPADKGCLVLNVSTAIAVYEALYEGRPVISRVLTVTGEGANAPCNVEVPMGMLLSDLLEATGGISDSTKKLLSGGPMMGASLSSTEVPVYKTSSAYVALTEDEVSSSKGTECIKCGRCSDICPERLFPTRIAFAVNTSNLELFKKYGGMECIECGSCAYICPAKRPLVQTIRYGKSEARKKK